MDEKILLEQSGLLKQFRIIDTQGNTVSLALNASPLTGPQDGPAPHVTNVKATCANGVQLEMTPDKTKLRAESNAPSLLVDQGLEAARGAGLDTSATRQQTPTASPDIQRAGEVMQKVIEKHSTLSMLAKGVSLLATGSTTIDLGSLESPLIRGCDALKSAMKQFTEEADRSRSR